MLLLTPGPAVLYIVARTIDQGRRAGLVSMLGVHVGTLVHVAAAAAGLSAVLTASATAFGAVTFLGAGYLIYLGIRRLLERPAPSAGATAHPPRLRRAFLDGVVVNVLNPKTALFFLAFLPQFVYALTAGTAAQWLRARPRFLAGERWISGVMYIGLGVAAALSSSHQPRAAMR